MACGIEWFDEEQKSVFLGGLVLNRISGGRVLALWPMAINVTGLSELKTWPKRSTNG